MKRTLLLVVAVILSLATVSAQKKNVAFVYQAGYGSAGYTVGIDPIHAALASNFNLTDFEIESSSVEADYATLKTFDLVVLSEAMSGNATLSNGLIALVGEVPLLSMKAYNYGGTGTGNYNSQRWSWAMPLNPTIKTPSVTITTGNEGHAIFNGLTVTDGVVAVFDGTNTSNNQIQGFDAVTYTSDTYKAFNNVILANATNGNDTYGTVAAIHEITGLSKKYMLIPISSDAISTVTENGAKLVVNACNYLMEGSSGEVVLTAATPVISMSYVTGKTTATITCATADATVYYTTDGSEPTASSSVYSAPIDFTAACTIKALAIKSGYTNSAVATAAIEIKSLPKDPVFTVNNNVLTISAESDVTVYYTTNIAATPSAKGNIYSGPITLSRSSVVKAIAIGAGDMASNVVSQYIEIAGAPYRGDTLYYSNMDTRVYSNNDWADVAFSTWTAMNTVDSTATLGGLTFVTSSTTGGSASIIRVGLTTGIAETDDDAGFSANAMCLRGVAGHTMTTESKFKAPFDFSVWTTNQSSGGACKFTLESSTDGSTWSVLGDTLETSATKATVRMFTSSIDGDGEYYLRIKSGMNTVNKNFVFAVTDLLIAGPSASAPVIPNAVKQFKNNADRSLISTSIYTINGSRVREYVNGVNIVRKVYSDGSVETEKVLIRNR